MMYEFIMLLWLLGNIIGYSLYNRLSGYGALKIAYSVALFFLVGGYLNILVMLVNGGKMPVKYLTNMDNLHKAMNNGTKLRFLADIFTIDNAIFSIGDVFIVIGSIIIIIVSMIYFLDIRITRKLKPGLYRINYKDKD